MITARFALALGLASLSLTLPTAASADDRAGAFRLALGVDVVGYQRQQTIGQSVFGTHPPSIYVGEREQLRSGLGTPRLGLELSGVVAPLVLVGVTTTLEHVDGAPIASAALGEADRVSWMVVPWVEIALLPGATVRPFLRGGVGIAGTYESYPGDHASYEELATQVAFSAMLGAHVFVTREVSLDPYVAASYANGDHVHTSSSEDPASDATTTGGIENVELSIGFALAAWLGP